MIKLTREEKLKIFEKLPKNLQDLMSSEDTGAFLLYLGQKYNFPDEKVHLLSKIVGDVILGLLLFPNLASEIANKIALDQNVASQIAQEINNELFAPVAHLLKGVPTSALATPKTTSPTSPYQGGEKWKVVFPTPSIDRYREPTAGPEVIDLRKTPPPPLPAPVSAAPIPPMLPTLSPTPSEQFRSNDRESSIKSGQNRGSLISQPNLKDLGEIGTKPAPPLTFTRLIEKPIKPIATPPLIEADPHKNQNDYRGPIIIRPPGFPPASNNDILDLRRDKGEF